MITKLERAFRLLLPADQAALAANAPASSNSSSDNNKDLLDLMQPMTGKERERMIYGRIVD
jgi:hypothetical protein